eukprot:TRINITY_DN470_c0_g1_i1.p2 TRINITY_DN470_c0_g1~~TRINITY_DN470_c0_g1_i1.p2  ORF type:complete len:311 (+),score=75.07 TRINITY_DN470_c0_g1_i1:123-1055(+)
MQIQFFFFFNDTATTEIYTLHIVGSVRCVQETGINAEYMGRQNNSGTSLGVDLQGVGAQAAVDGVSSGGSRVGAGVVGGEDVVASGAGQVVNTGGQNEVGAGNAGTSSGHGGDESGQAGVGGSQGGGVLDGQQLGLDGVNGAGVVSNAGGGIGSQGGGEGLGPGDLAVNSGVINGTSGHASQDGPHGVSQGDLTGSDLGGPEVQASGFSGTAEQVGVDLVNDLVGGQAAELGGVLGGLAEVGQQGSGGTSPIDQVGSVGGASHVSGTTKVCDVQLLYQCGISHGITPKKLKWFTALNLRPPFQEAPCTLR